MKSVKTHPKRVLVDKTPTFEELCHYAKVRQCSLFNRGSFNCGAVVFNVGCWITRTDSHVVNGSKNSKHFEFDGSTIKFSSYSKMAYRMVSYQDGTNGDT